MFKNLRFILSFDAPEQQRGQQTLLPVCEVPCHVGPEVSTSKGQKLRVVHK